MTLMITMKSFIRALLCSLVVSASTVPVANALEVLCAGDSITQGLQRTGSGIIFGIKSPQNGSVNVGGYQSRLNTMLDSNIEPSTLYNWGFGGENSAGGLGRINSILDSRSADIILIMYGANDLYQGISSSGTKANIRAMIDRSRSKGVIPIISTITPNTNGSFNPSIRLDYNPKLYQVANEKQVAIAENYLVVDGPNWYTVPYHSGDFLHLSNAGYEKMAQAWFDVIEELLVPNKSIIPIIELFLFD